MEPAKFVRERRVGVANTHIPTRSSLLSRLKDASDQEGWVRFYETYWKLIYNTAVQEGLTGAEAQDVVQETLIAVWKTIPAFIYDRTKGSFQVWLLKQTAWRIMGQFRKRLPVKEWLKQARADTWTAALEQVPDPATSALEVSCNEEWEETLLTAALNRVRAKVAANQYQIFELAVRTGWTASQVARNFRISRPRVYLTKHRVGNLLRKELLKLRTDPTWF